ncbi:MAG: prolyl-tRNA synthetase associated domain-containing protein [Rhodospirillales bacterium]|nr:prolyl-tRNA synthetase associated domain-containing protein [Rhodospirillales bacterium]
MTATPEELLARLDALGLHCETHRHPPVFTVEESKALRGDLPGGHCKNLFLKDKKGALWLVVAAEERAIDLKDLRRRIGAAALSFGKPDLLRQVLGVEPGSVSPFALINDTGGRVNVVLDKEMMAEPLLNYHPLDNARTTSIAPEGLLVFLRNTGHNPRIVEL